MFDVLIKLKARDYTILEGEIFSEENLGALAALIDNEPMKSEVILDLVVNISKFGHNFDWNVGSTLRHLDAQMIIKVLPSDAHDR